MNDALPETATVGIVGAGTMGGGIAQVAAAAGHRVLLFDTRQGAPAKAREQIAAGLGRLAARGKLTADKARKIVDRIVPTEALADLAPASLVIEAIVEDLAAKQVLFASLEELVAADTVLATNTSSLSITAIAGSLKRPERFVGIHFFNPAPVMRLVEIVSGLATDAGIAACAAATAKRWGKATVELRSSPGFIVNRVARPFYGEALRLLEEGTADAQTLDLILTEAAGFRMGPFALMDLIGHDVNAAVTQSMFDASGNDPRYRPSWYQRELIAAGRLGRKAGRGVFDYSEAATKSVPSEPSQVSDGPAPFALDGSAHDLEGTALLRTDGRPAVERALAERRPVIVYDLVADTAQPRRVAVACSPDVPGSTLDRLTQTLSAAGTAVSLVADRPGLVAMRTVAMLANEAFEAVLNGVASEDGVDRAMELGVNYPHGPVAWAKSIGLGNVLGVLTAVQSATGDPRYRASLGLRLAAGAEALAA